MKDSVIGGEASGFLQQTACREEVIFRKKIAEAYPKVKVSGAADAMSPSANGAIPSW